MQIIDKGKKNVLGVLVDAMDYNAAVEKIVSAARSRANMSVSALAVHGVMTGVLDPVQRYRINHLDMVVPDGQPVRWALNWLYNAGLTDRVRGSTLMLKVCARAAEEGLPIFLYGSTPAVLKSLISSLKIRFPGLIIASTEPSRFKRLTSQEKQEVINNVLQSSAAITFVGLGCPRQEAWAYEYRDDIPMPIIAVGAAFDFLSGLTSQAPLFLQRSGMEWCYRLLQNPVRLWRRYLLLNPFYLILLSLQVMGLVRFDPQDCAYPKEQLGNG